MKIQKNNFFKYSIGFIACLLFRLMPFRPPNIEPVLATQMPFARVYGGFVGFSFGFFSIILFDVFTSGIGVWTFVTALSYGMLGLWAGRFFKNKKNTGYNYAKFAVMSTLLYDLVTGLSVGPLVFNQPLIQALMGQIPFTLLHLVGNVSLALLVSPAIDHLLVKEKNKKNIYNINQLNQKYIS